MEQLGDGGDWRWLVSKVLEVSGLLITERRVSQVPCFEGDGHHEVFGLADSGPSGQDATESYS